MPLIARWGVSVFRQDLATTTTDETDKLSYIRE